MGFLNRLFGSTKDIIQELEADEESIESIWKDYFNSIPQKKTLIDEGTPAALEQLHSLLNHEIVDIEGEEKTEEEIITDLEKVEHKKKIERIHKLEVCLGYAESQYQYSLGLLMHLHDALKAEAHLLDQSKKESYNHERLIKHLREQLHLEVTIVAKIQKIDSFHNLFIDLMKGEHTVSTLSESEKSFVQLLEKRMQPIFLGSVAHSIIVEWAVIVLRTIEDKTHERVAEEMLLNYKWDFPEEIVYSDEFPSIVHDKLNEVIPDTHSEKLVGVFVSTFREWFEASKNQ